MLIQVYTIFVFTFIQGIRSQDRNKLPRYVIEPGIKPAIVGSYSYNLLKGDFEAHTNSTASATEATVTSTTLKEDNTFRKHASVSATLNQFNWWTRSTMPRNITKKIKSNISQQTIKSL